MSIEDENHLRLARDEWKARAEKAERERDSVLRQIALALDWGNVPPLDVLVKDIRARRTGGINRERALAAAQARERELRAALLAISKNLAGLPTETHHTRRDGDAARAALSAPQGTTALREFGLKVAEAAVGDIPGSHDYEAIVAAVLKGLQP